MSPSSSASGTNSRGSTRPPIGCAHRTSASKPMIRPRGEVVDRLVVREEVGVVDGGPQLALLLDARQHRGVHLLR